MEAIIITPVVFITIYMIIELFVHRKERLMLIDKAAQNQNIDIRGLLQKTGSGFSFSALKIGCLLSGLGVGFFVSFALRIALQHCMQDWGTQEMLSIASVLTFGGLGMIVAYLIDKPKK